MDEQELEVATQEVRRQALQVAQTASMVRVGLQALGTQILLLLGMILDATMFGWAMYAGSWERISAALLFSMATWFLIKVSPRPPTGEGHEA